MTSGVAVITGAGRGLGRAWAGVLAGQGMRLALIGRDPDLRAERALLRDLPGDHLAVHGDLSRADTLNGAAAQILQQFGAVQVLVNNAGMSRDRSFARADTDDLRAVLEVNLIGTLHLTRAFWPGMLAQGYGRVVFTTSAAGLAGNFGQSAYAAAKMGLVGAMHCLGIEGEGKGVHVNCLSPLAATDMNAGLLPADMQAELSPTALAPDMLALTGAEAPNRQIRMAGGGRLAEAAVFVRGADPGWRPFRDVRDQLPG